MLLAAGAGARFGQPKAEVVLDGTRLVDRAVGVLRAGGCAEVIAVVRPGTDVAHAWVVPNPAPERGMSSSLQLGLAAAAQTPADVAVVLLVDLPGVAAAAVRAVIDRHAAGATVVAASYAGTRGHPIAFDRSTWPDVAAIAHGDKGARGYLAAHPDLVSEVACDGAAHDVDTPEDLQTWLALRRQ